MNKIFLKDKVQVSDPCYGYGIWCAVTLDNVLSGKWCVDVEEYRGRNVILEARHCYYPNRPILEYKGDCGVDSGQLGIFNADYYESNCGDNNYDDVESWYRRMCELTLNEPKWGIADGGDGVVSESGYGDGCYPLYVSYNDGGKIVGIRVEFI